MRVNMCSLVSSTQVSALDRSYMRTTNLYNVLRSVSVTSVGNWLRLLKVSVTSSDTSHVCHADLSPIPLKADTTSHPEKAWKYIIPLALAGPMARSSWIGIHFMPTPWPKAVHTKYQRQSPVGCSCCNTDTAIMTIYVSLALITRALLPSIAAYSETEYGHLAWKWARVYDSCCQEVNVNIQMNGIK